MDKKIIISIVILVLVAFGAFGGYIVYKNNSKGKLSVVEGIEAQIRKAIENNIENWVLYEKVTEAQYKKFGNDPACSASLKGDPDFLNYYTKAQEGDIYRLDLTNGAYVVYTQNYNNWDNARLSSFGVDDMRICSGGWLIPLYAYPDKIVWGNITCSGIGGSQAEACSMITRIVMGYFSSK